MLHTPYSDAMCKQDQFSTSPFKMRFIFICASGKHLRTFLHGLEFIFVHLHILKSDMSSFHVDSNFKWINCWNARNIQRTWDSKTLFSEGIPFITLRTDDTCESQTCAQNKAWWNLVLRTAFCNNYFHINFISELFLLYFISHTYCVYLICTVYSKRRHFKCKGNFGLPSPIFNSYKSMKSKVFFLNK